jgi:hypothetical protein
VSGRVSNIDRHTPAIYDESPMERIQRPAKSVTNF